MSHWIFLLSLRTLLIHGLLAFSGLCEVAVPDTLFRATTGPSCNSTWNLQLPVWHKLLSNSTHVKVLLDRRSTMPQSPITVGYPTVGWFNGLRQPDLIRSTSVLVSRADRVGSSAPLMIQKWGCPTDNQYQEAILTLSGSGFKQEIRVIMRIEGSCQIVEVISKCIGPNRTLQSMVFALSLSPQPSNMALLLEESTRLSIDSFNKTGHYVRSEDTEQISVDVAEIKQLAKRHGLISDMSPRDIKIGIDCDPADPPGFRCQCYGLDTTIRLDTSPQKPGRSPPVELNRAVIWVLMPLAVILLLVLASTRSLVNYISLPKILVVSLDGEVDALCGQLASLPLPGLRLSLLQGHRLTGCSLQKALRRASSTTVRTFLLAGIETTLTAEDCTPVVRIGLNVWRKESARFSLLLYHPHPPAVAEAAVADDEQALQKKLQQILGESEVLDGVLRWTIVGDVEAASAYFRDEQRTLEDAFEADEAMSDIETAEQQPAL